MMRHSDRNGLNQPANGTASVDGAKGRAQASHASARMRRVTARQRARREYGECFGSGTSLNRFGP